MVLTINRVQPAGEPTAFFGVRAEQPAAARQAADTAALTADQISQRDRSNVVQPSNNGSTTSGWVDSSERTSSRVRSACIACTFSQTTPRRARGAPQWSSRPSSLQSTPMPNRKRPFGSTSSEATSFASRMTLRWVTRQDEAGSLSRLVRTAVLVGHEEPGTV